MDYGSILNFEGAENIKNGHDLLEYECEILVPAALEKQITKKNAGNKKRERSRGLAYSCFHQFIG